MSHGVGVGTSFSWVFFDQGMIGHAPVTGAAFPELDRHPDTSHGVTGVEGADRRRPLS